jgi:DNA-binding transcriptional MerR regulator
MALLLSSLAAGLALAALAAALAGRRREAVLEARLGEVTEQLAALSRQMDAAEHDLSMVVSSAGVAENLLVEKGLADEDEVAAARRRVGALGSPPSGDDAMH